MEKVFRAVYGVLHPLILQRVSAILAVISLVFSPLNVYAQGKQISFIRDAEIEQEMRNYLDPLLGAAGLRKGFIRVVLVSDRSFNAFVADGKRVFVNIGVIMEAATPNQIIGVLAHETGHIMGGHLARIRNEVDKATAIAVIGAILGGAILVGSARSRTNSDASIGGIGAILGGGEAAQRSLLAYQRGEERAADRSALALLEKTKQSAKGLLETFERMANDTLFSSTRMDRYLQSHPLPQDRVADLRETAPKGAYFAVKDSAARQAKLDRLKAKLFGFTADQQEIKRRYPPYDKSLAARYARIMADYRFGRPFEAIQEIDQMIAQEPQNPYLFELKGQFLLESGQATQALPSLRKAVQLAPQQPLIRTMLGHALLAQNTPSSLQEAIRELNHATAHDPDNYEGFRYLSQAYSAKGEEGNAALAGARGAMIEGASDEARLMARRAMNLLPANSPGYLSAKDIYESKAEKQPF